MRLVRIDYSSRAFLYGPIGLFLLLALGVCVSWWISADRLSSRLDAMNGKEVVPGITLYFGERSVTGFPFNLDTEMRDVTFTIATPHGPAQWHTDRFAMHALTYGPDETLFEAAGQQVLHWTRDDGNGRTLTIAVGSLHASAILRHHALARFDLDVVGFGSKAFTAQRLQFHLRHDGSAFDLYTTADDVRFPDAKAPGLGNRIASASLSGRLSDGDIFGTLLRGEDHWFTAVDVWRQSGGAFLIDNATFDWAGLRLNGHGSLKLDSLHRPAGTIAIHADGIPALRARSKAPLTGPDKGIAQALLEVSGPASRADTTLGFENGIVAVGGEPADTVTKLY